MDRLLGKLERRLGRFAVPKLTTFLVGGMVIAFVLSMVRPDFADMLTLDPVMVRRGQVWRLVSFLFLPSTMSPLWFMFDVYWLWLIGTNLENEWGSFKYNAYWLVGIVGMIVAAFLTHGAAGNDMFLLAMGLAFATLFPDYQIFLFFILPVRVKWIAMLIAAWMIFTLVSSDWPGRAATIASLGNYLLFFGGHLWGLLRARNVQVRQAARRAELSSARPPASGRGGETTSRTCAICGASEDDGADIRVCSCEKCGGSPGRTLCLPHARSH